MAEENPSLQIDTDWKKQAQEEKRRLAEQQKLREQQAATQAPPVIGTAGAAATAPTTAPGDPRQRSAASGGAGPREMPPASFATLVQSLVTQALFYMGDLAVRGGEPVVNLDMAKHHIDSLGVLEEKTKGNLTPE